MRQRSAIIKPSSSQSDAAAGFEVMKKSVVEMDEDLAWREKYHVRNRNGRKIKGLLSFIRTKREAGYTNTLNDDSRCILLSNERLNWRWKKKK